MFFHYLYSKIHDFKNYLFWGPTSLFWTLLNSSLDLYFLLFFQYHLLNTLLEYSRKVKMEMFVFLTLHHVITVVHVFVMGSKGVVFYSAPRDAFQRSRIKNAGDRENRWMKLQIGGKGVRWREARWRQRPGEKGRLPSGSPCYSRGSRQRGS